MIRRWEDVACALIMLMGWSLLLAASPDSPDSPDQAEDLDEVITTLTDLGLDPTTAEQEEWQAEVSDRPSGEKGPPWSGFFRAGGQQQADGAWRWRGHFTQSWGAWSSGIRGGWPGQPDPLAGMFLQWEKSTVTGIVGHLGLTTGSGLLLSSPGRSGSLVADGSLVSTRTRLVGKTSRPDRRTVEGFGGRLLWRRLEIHGVIGRMPKNDALAHGQVLATSLKYGVKKLWIGLQGLKVPGGMGWGGAGRVAGTIWQGQAEFAVRRETEIGAHQVDWVTEVTLRPASGWLFEGAMTASAGKDFWGLGQRPGLLKGDEGRAWALRVATKLGSDTRLAALWGQSRTRRQGSEAQLELNSTGDLILTHRAGRPWTLTGRVLVTGKDRRTWQERFPWLPSDNHPIKHKSLVQGTLGHVTDLRDLRLTAKFLRQTDGSGTRWRRLWSLRGHFVSGASTRIRVGYGQAWGDDVDLVTALVPVPGRILPRHWGQWQSETHLSLGWQGGWSEFWGAVSWRRPETQDPAGGAWEAWLEGRVRW